MKSFIVLSLIMVSATIVHAEQVKVFSIESLPLEFNLPEQKPQAYIIRKSVRENLTIAKNKFHSNCEIVQDGKTHTITFKGKDVIKKEYPAGGLTIGFKLHKGEINLDVKGKNIEPQLLEESFGHKVYMVGKIKVTCDTKSPIERVIYALLDPKTNQAFTKFVQQHDPSYLTSKTVGTREKRKETYEERIKQLVEQTQ